jgi:hypothetical protein
MRTRLFTLVAITLAMSVLMLGASGQAADPMVGTWKLNLSKSKFEPGPGPRSTTIQVEEDGDMLRVRVAMIESDGKPTQFGYSVKKDGKEYPVTVNGVPSAGTTIWRRVDQRTTDMIAKQGGKELSRKRVIVSPDGRTQTSTSSGTDSKGQKYNVMAIFEKQ